MNESKQEVILGFHSNSLASDYFPIPEWTELLSPERQVTITNEDNSSVITVTGQYKRPARPGAAATKSHNCPSSGGGGDEKEEMESRPTVFIS